MAEQDNTPAPVPNQQVATKLPIPPDWQIPRPTKSVEVNSMHYTDEKGAKHLIYLPKGTARISTKLLMEKMYDELARFPPYENQGYTNWDNDPETYAEFIESLKKFEYLFEERQGEDILGLVDPAEGLADQAGDLNVAGN